MLTKAQNVAHGGAWLKVAFVIYSNNLKYLFTLNDPFHQARQMELSKSKAPHSFGSKTVIMTFKQLNESVGVFESWQRLLIS